MNKDTIYRQAAIDALLEEVRLVDGYYVENDEVINKDDAIEAIRLLPSAQPYTDEEIQKIQELEQAEIQKAFQLGREDALSEVVRCKDCKEGTYSSDCTIICEYLNNAFSPDDYCSYGERREDG